MVSTPTMVQMRKKRMSKRPKFRRSFCRSTVAATVVVSRVSVIRGAPGGQQGDNKGTGRHIRVTNDSAVFPIGDAGGLAVNAHDELV
jgi:hypothetical protein